MFETTRINNKKITPIPVFKKDERPIYGYDAVPIIYSNFYCMSKKFTGKSTLLYNMVKYCVNKDTVFYGFCTTHEKDDSYIMMKTLLDKKGCHYEFFDSLEPLEGVIAMLRDFHPDDEEEEPPEDVLTTKIYEEDYAVEVKVKKRKPRFRSQKFFLLFDDISQQLHGNLMLASLMKMNRHLRCKVIIASQYLNDVPKQARYNLDGWAFGKGINKKKILEAFESLDTGVDAETFWKMYEYATQKPYSFFVVYPSLNDFRIGFDTRISPPE